MPIQMIQKVNIAPPLEMAPPYLTPDALMSYCSTRLRGLDEQIQTGFEKQRSANEQSKVLGELNDSLGAGPSSGDWNQTELQNAMLVAAAKFDAAALRVPDPLKRQLIDQAWQCKLVAGGNQTTMSNEQYKKLTSDPVSNMQKDLNSGTELAMINLQSLMSQRQSAVQLVTNMVQSLGDQVNKIAANNGP
jgi:hypothetical protein